MIILRRAVVLPPLCYLSWLVFYGCLLLDKNTPSIVPDKIGQGIRSRLFKLMRAPAPLMCVLVSLESEKTHFLKQVDEKHAGAPALAPTFLVNRLWRPSSPCTQVVQLIFSGEGEVML